MRSKLGLRGHELKLINKAHNEIRRY